jgi:L-alanine-DL-glutamate epimerase-like enolase superfamily enzyme
VKAAPLKITAIRLDRMRLPLDPPFYAAWDPVPRRHFDATLVRVETDEGVTGYGSPDTMDGFEPFESASPSNIVGSYIPYWGSNCPRS